jgi:hypothetical protein
MERRAEGQPVIHSRGRVFRPHCLPVSRRPAGAACHPRSWCAHSGRTRRRGRGDTRSSSPLGASPGNVISWPAGSPSLRARSEQTTIELAASSARGSVHGGRRGGARRRFPVWGTTALAGRPEDALLLSSCLPPLRTAGTGGPVPRRRRRGLLAPLRASKCRSPNRRGSVAVGGAVASYGLTPYFGDRLFVRNVAGRPSRQPSGGAVFIWDEGRRSSALRSGGMRASRRGS